MKVLRFILILGGIALLGLGIYSKCVVNGPITISGEPLFSVEGYENQAYGMMGIGVLAILASLFSKSRR